MNSDDVKQLVTEQLEAIDDIFVRSTIEDLLVEPFSQNRELSCEIYYCWVVAEHPDSDTSYVYCRNGIVPSLFWGIVSISGLEMGMDSNWFETLEDAFYDSFASIPLTIWNVVKRDASDNDRIIASSLSHDESDRLITKLNEANGDYPQSRETYYVEPRTKQW